MNTEDKRMLFFDMQDHPERYTDEEFKQMLDDPEMQEFIQIMTDFRMATIAEENSEKNNTVMTVRGFSILRKIAAVAIGILFISGLTFAAVKLGIIGHSHNGNPAITEHTDDKQEKVKQAITNDTINKRDTLTMPVIYEEAELHTIMTALSSHYGVEVIYKNENARNIRLYFVWNPTDKLEVVVSMINKFDRINIRQENFKLIVE